MQPGIFRKEALDYHNRAQFEGEVLLVPPNWARWTYRLLLGLLAVSIVFVVVAPVSRYARGPAVIRAEQRLALTATTPGTVGSVRVTPGMRVKRGDLLIQLHAAEEEAQLTAVQREFDSTLVRMLADPLDRDARQTLAGLRVRRDLLASRLGDRLVRAPEAGTVGDVRVKPGQSVAPGELIVSIVRERARFSVLAFLPGQQRPALREGQLLRLELVGYQYLYQNLTIDGVDDEIVGPNEVRRMLGSEIADSIPLAGPVVVVHASLPDATFRSGSDVYQYFDGMHARVRVRTRSERLLTSLFPWIRIIVAERQR